MDFQSSMRKCLRNQSRFVPYFSDEYPKQLREIPDFPYAIYVKGRLPGEEQKNVALIGARRCTPYGEKYAIDFAVHWRKCGVGIISGMARGIDGMGTEAHFLQGDRLMLYLDLV